jgi:hypothetical protein
MTIVLVLLLTFFTGIVGIGLGIDGYLRFVQVAREAAMIGAKIENLSANNQACTTSIDFRLDSGLRPKVSGGTPPCDGGHLLMHDRANTLLSIMPIEIASATHRSFYNNDPNINTVRYELNVRFRSPVPVLLLFREVPISLSVEAAKINSGITVGLNDSGALKNFFTSSGLPSNWHADMGAVFNLTKAVGPQHN